jgi:hypothetical protein
MAVDAFVLILAMLLVGWLFARTRMLPANSGEVLNLVVLYVCLPAAVLRYAAQLQFDPALLGLMLVPWTILLASAALVHVLARLLRFSDGERAVLLLLVPLGNTSFLGFPLVEALLGAAALPYAVVYDQFGSFLLLSSWGLWVLARYGGDTPPSAGLIARRVLRFPPFIALVLALTVMPAEPPAVVATMLERLAEAMLPLVTLAIGLTIRLRLPRRELAPLGVGLLAKLALMPALAWLLLPLFGLSGDAARVAVLETAMPPMITAAAMAASHRLAPALASALVGYGIVLSLATLPLWTMLLRNL